jgi:hypothetical protein
MKRLLPLFCILVILFASVGVASANSSQPDQFTVTGCTTGEPNARPGLVEGRTAFNLIAAGPGGNCPEGGVSGDLEGSFTFKEWGSVNLTTYQGVNTGLLTINKKNNPTSQVTIWFGGKIDYFALDPEQVVRGTWRVIEGKGAWKDLEGRGTYTGGVIDPFTVIFTGKLD